MAAAAEGVGAAVQAAAAKRAGGSKCANNKDSKWQLERKSGREGVRQRE